MFSKLAAVLVIFAGAGLAQYSTPGNRFASVGIGSNPEQGAIFEVKQSGAAFTGANDATPYAIFATAGGYNAVVFANPAYSTDLGDGFEIISLQNGTQEFNVGCGGTGPKCMDFTLDPVTGKIQFDVNAFTVAMSGATASTMSEFHTFGGTGTSTLNIFEIKAFPDPDAGGGHITSQLEAFMTSTADTSSNQSGSGVTFSTQDIGGTGHGGYRLGVNAIYTTAGTVFSNNGFTLYDYANAENIFVASTTRPHTFLLGNNVFLIVPATTTSGLGSCSDIGEGAIKPVIDSDTNTWGATVVHSTGALHVLAYCDGTNWTVMGK